MNDKISVIVPIYKVEDYLKRCVDSIVNQTHKNLEIILVDDGSPDGCPALCDQFAAMDDRVKVIHKDNGGLSDARNEGVRISTGTYIIFIDSDDFIDQDMIELMYKEAKQKNADMVIMTHRYEGKEETESFFYRTSKQIETLNGVEALHLMLSRIGWTAWGKLIRREIALQFDFVKGKLYEDMDYIPKVTLASSVVVVMLDGLYHYVIRENSIMGQTKNVTKVDYIELSSATIDYINNYNLNISEKRKLQAWMFILFYRTYCNQYLSKGEHMRKVFVSSSKKYIIKNFKLIIFNRALPIKYKIGLTCIMISDKINQILYKIGEGNASI